MSRGTPFIIEGLKAFERILKTNRFSELYTFLGGIFIKILGVIRISDPVMELMVINYFDRILKPLPALYLKCLNKIK